jgi:hypothetical protein
MAEQPIDDTDNLIDKSTELTPATRRRDVVLYKSYVTYRYHRRRQRFFDLADKGTKAATVLLGASLLGNFVKDQLPYIASAISGLGLMALVFGYSERKQSHKELAELTMQFISKVEEATPDELTDAIVGKWDAEFARLNSREPPALKTLVIICEHEQSAAIGHPGLIPLPRWYKRLTADFIS